jgi:hypothetical protein
MSLQHNALIYNYGFLKVLLNFLFFIFEKDLGVFYCSIIYYEMTTKYYKKTENKTNKKYFCDKCNFYTCKKTDFNRHLNTIKHLKLHNTTNFVEKNDKMYKCNCGKVYKHHSSLYNHKKTCNTDINVNNNIYKENILLETNNEKDNIDYKTMFLELINENKELRKTITELIPKVGNNNNNINKNKFNINVFLNEKCKDALSMDEFIDKIEVSMKNLLTTKEKGQIHGISNIIIENMNKLSLYERPLHCTDKKRETLYVKNQEWEKDENKEFINKALKSVESKQLKNLNVWLEEHPNYMNNPSEQEEFAKLMSECGKSIDDGKEKIIKKLCDNVYIEKPDD